MLKGVLFDFDGVVVQSEPLHMATFLELLAPYGVNVSEGHWYKEFAGTGSRHIFEVLTAEYNIPLDVDALVAKRKKIYETHVRAGELKEMPGIRSFLVRLRERGIKTAIVSGSHRSNVELTLSIFDLNRFFDIVVSGDDIKLRKPDPGPFLYAADKLGLDSSECLAIEDSVSGCESARRAGMKLVVIKSPALQSVGKYDLLVKDFSSKNMEKIMKFF
jgi:HAD superfamily hydrolase (TIGR01509 family)